WMQSDAPMGKLKFYPKKRELELFLPAATEPLFNEVAESRLNSLANALKSETRVIMQR
ncbi:exopolyphosphatase, partial [Roseibium sp. RKSG952]|nr:exopolyphosphatase [Roseibium sp. RKSG952]